MKSDNYKRPAHRGQPVWHPPYLPKPGEMSSQTHYSPGDTVHTDWEDEYLVEDDSWEDDYTPMKPPVMIRRASRLQEQHLQASKERISRQKQQIPASSKIFAFFMFVGFLVLLMLFFIIGIIVLLMIMESIAQANVVEIMGVITSAATIGGFSIAIYDFFEKRKKKY